uniref:MEKHLA domain-containing protein n=1 Tax=Cucumis melo TaxID=3656 RepID=A0A9I9EBH8_CUCME
MVTQRRNIYGIIMMQFCVVPSRNSIEGFAYIPAGICMSRMRRHASFEQVVAWKVLAEDESTVHYLAFSFVNWSYL